MPFVIPKKYTLLNNTRFSEYSDIEQSPDGLLLLQQKDATGSHGLAASMKGHRERKAPFRIVTAAFPRYEVAHGYSLEELRRVEWRYCIELLPVPASLTDKESIAQWLIAHFTQLAIDQQHGAESRGVSLWHEFAHETTGKAAEEVRAHSNESSPNISRDASPQMPAKRPNKPSSARAGRGADVDAKADDVKIDANGAVATPPGVVHTSGAASHEVVDAHSTMSTSPDSSDMTGKSPPPHALAPEHASDMDMPTVDDPSPASEAPKEELVPPAFHLAPELADVTEREVVEVEDEEKPVKKDKSISARLGRRKQEMIDRMQDTKAKVVEKAVKKMKSLAKRLSSHDPGTAASAAGAAGAVHSQHRRRSSLPSASNLGVAYEDESPMSPMSDPLDMPPYGDEDEPKVKQSAWKEALSHRKQEMVDKMKQLARRFEKRGKEHTDASSTRLRKSASAGATLNSDDAQRLALQQFLKKQRPHKDVHVSDADDADFEDNVPPIPPTTPPGVKRWPLPSELPLRSQPPGASTIPDGMKKKRRGARMAPPPVASMPEAPPDVVHTMEGGVVVALLAVAFNIIFYLLVSAEQLDASTLPFFLYASVNVALMMLFTQWFPRQLTLVVGSRADSRGNVSWKTVKASVLQDLDSRIEELEQQINDAAARSVLAPNAFEEEKGSGAPVPLSRSKSGTTLLPSALAARGIDEADEEEDRLLFGSSIPKHAPTDMHAQGWCDGDGTTFPVRVGPNYAKNKKKANSLPAMFETIGMDGFATDRKLPDLEEWIEYPTAENVTEERHRKALTEWRAELGIPTCFCLHICFPRYAPSVMGGPNDGENWTLVFYTVMNETGYRAVKDGTPAGKLLRRFFENIDDRDYQERLKVLPRVADCSPVKLPGWVAQWNGKPFLTRPQHDLYKTDNRINVMMDFHRFPYMARKGFLTFVDSMFPQLIAEIGMTVEGRPDDELPEQVMFSVQMSRLDFRKLNHLI